MTYGLRHFGILGMILILAGTAAIADSFDFPMQGHGFSIGNSQRLSGLRLNWQDRAARISPVSSSPDSVSAAIDSPVHSRPAWAMVGAR